MADVAYQRAGQVRQLLAERENAVAYGQDTSRMDKQLAELGYKPEQPVKAAPASQGPQGRQGRPRQTTDASKASASKNEE